MKWHSMMLFLSLLMMPVIGSAQTPRIDTTVVNSEDIQVLRTKRGDIFLGHTELLSTDSLRFSSQEGLLLAYKLDQIDWLGFVQHASWLREQMGISPEMQDLPGKSSLHRHENLLYSFTAFPFPKGGGEYRNIDLLYNTVDFGISNNFSVGAGSVIPFILILRAKLSFEINEKLHIGAGANNGVAYGEDTEGAASHFFGILTIGPPKSYLNFTVGPAFDWTFTPDSPVICTVGGGATLSNHWRIYSDIGLAFGYEVFIPTVLLSWFNERNRLEFGVLSVPSDFFVTIPMVSYARKF